MQSVDPDQTPHSVAFVVVVVGGWKWGRGVGGGVERGRCIAPDKREYQINIFLISPQKHMLWVLIRSISVRCFR